MHNIALDAHEEGINMWDRDVVRYIDFRSGGFAITSGRKIFNHFKQLIINNLFCGSSYFSYLCRVIRR